MTRLNGVQHTNYVFREEPPNRMDGRDNFMDIASLYKPPFTMWQFFRALPYTPPHRLQLSIPESSGNSSGITDTGFMNLSRSAPAAANPAGSAARDAQ
jgi:hypothetical protein